MAQYRPSGLDRFAVRGYENHQGNGGVTDHVSLGIRAPPLKQSRNRRFRSRKLSIGAVIVVLCVGFVVSVVAFVYLSGDKGAGAEVSSFHAQDDDTRIDPDFLTNVTRTQKSKVLKFGHGSIEHARDSRYWDKDDRRRDEDYSEDVLEHTNTTVRDRSTDKVHIPLKRKNHDRKSPLDESHTGSDRKGVGLYNEAGRNELKMYEAEYEASLKSAGQSQESNIKHISNLDMGVLNEDMDADDEYGDSTDSHDAQIEEDYDSEHGSVKQSDVAESKDAKDRESSDSLDSGMKGRNIAEETEETEATEETEENEEALTDISDKDYSSNPVDSRRVIAKTSHTSDHQDHPARRSTSHRRSISKKKPKRRKFSSTCEMKFLNSTAQLVEPVESPNFARFSLQYKEVEEKAYGQNEWEPRFAGHQSLTQREESFLARDQKINCGFIKGTKGSASTGFDLAEDDTKYISTCHIAVISCIFGNSDRLRAPMGKTVSRLSRKYVCFVMFVDEMTLQTLSSEGQMPDRMGFIGIWKIVVVKNLPYSDMRRVGKIPKLLPHRLFPSARYSIWLDSKLRLQLDPMLILEYFLWRKGSEYAISNHYDRHCVWEEVAQNKKLNKYNHTVIDEQFEFYRNDGLKRFNASDPNKLLPSNVPEGSFIVRAHTPMSNLFSCLWFNEVERFTPRDQLSFAFTYHKLRRMNPDKPFYLNMFKDCERRTIAKLFHHRSEERRTIQSTRIS